MKKWILLSGIFAGLLCLLASFNSVTDRNHRKPSLPKSANLPGSITNRAAIPAALYFKLHPIPSTVMVRRDIYTLTAAQITSIKTGITAMEALPYTDPTSWQYQAAIHGTLLTASLPSWNSCQHGSPFFLSWHRMYLYFFERILRAKSGDPTLTLPYWNYQSNPVLPPAYRDATPGNPLYDGTRYASINGGGAIPSGILTDFSNVVANDVHYYVFSSDLENPHGAVHVTIGGNMGSVPTSALDPCFWLHHTNIDRLWEQWLRICGRSNPSDTTYLKQSFTFFDETGAAVVMTGSQILHTATQLNYQYDFTTKPKPCKVRWPWWKWRWKPYYLIQWPQSPIPVDDILMQIKVPESGLGPLQEYLKNPANRTFYRSESGLSDLVYLEMADINVKRMPEGVIEVYLNLPAGEAPNPKSKSYAGTINLFGLKDASGQMDMAMHLPKIAKLNITQAIHALGLQPAGLAHSSISFYSRGIRMRGEDLKAGTDIEIGKLSLMVQKAQH